MSNTHRISLRIDDTIYDFIKDFSEFNEINNISETIRRMLIYFWAKYLLGELNETLPEVKSQLLKFNKKKRLPKVMNILKEV
jgi:metal-responsive CopG/Arc/MetJ family transcriptional regulator